MLHKVELWWKKRQRILNNPDELDLMLGDAPNALLEQLSNPMISSVEPPALGEPIPGEIDSTDLLPRRDHRLADLAGPADACAMAGRCRCGTRPSRRSGGRTRPRSRPPSRRTARGG